MEKQALLAQYRLVGSFVSRRSAQWDRFLANWRARGSMEVLRAACPVEKGSEWFYPLVGTGVFLNLSECQSSTGVYKLTTSPTLDHIPLSVTHLNNSVHRLDYPGMPITRGRLFPELFFTGIPTFVNGYTGCGSGCGSSLRSGYG